MAGQSNTGHQTYYVPESSPLAVLATVGLATMLFSFAAALNDMHPTYGDAGEGSSAWFFFFCGLGLFVATIAWWFRTTIKENLKGLNSAQLKRSYVLGMQWFIFSEVMFFAAFFGALWYVRNLAGPWLAGQGDGELNQMLWPGFEFSWPLMETPQEAVGGPGKQVPAVTGEYSGPGQNLSFPGWGNLFGWLPLWNTVILLSSSFTVHIAHLGLKEGNRKKLNTWLFLTVALGAIFLVVQYLEYHHAYVEMGLTLNSGIYGTTFFMLTGFHGAHVTMGAIMLLVMWLRSAGAGHFTKDDHFGFEAASWYWHFVDVVWVGLFLFVYII